MRKLLNTSIGLRMHGVAATACLALVALGSLAAEQMRTDRCQQRRDRTQAVVETALGAIAHYGRLEASGGLTRVAAQATALGVLKSLRYGAADY